jgi:hypothetical protein
MGVSLVAGKISEIQNFVAGYLNVAPGNIDVNRRLVEDLNIVGDDAEDLIREYAEKFKVDMSEFDFEFYFPTESQVSSFLYWFSGLLGFRRSRPEVTIRKLAEIAERGRWPSQPTSGRW